MVRIRLRRVGAKGQPSFRLVAADKESPRDGRFLENLGYYNPRTEPATIQLKEDRIFEWMANGAQLSDAAEKVLSTAGTLDRYERYKGGEDLETLLEEAKAAEEARNINPKTTHVVSEPKPKKKPEVEVKEEETVAPAEEEVVESEDVEEEVEIESQIEDDTGDEPVVESDTEPDAEPEAEETAEIEEPEEEET